MSSSLHKPVVAILFAAVLISSGEFEQWCVADPNTPDEDLLAALDWACGTGGANCSMIQVGQPCYLPDTPKDHASFAFNSYYQKFKHRGCSCNFRSTAMVADLDPSKEFDPRHSPCLVLWSVSGHGSCRYDYFP